jgi:hypothetical protein
MAGVVPLNSFSTERLTKSANLYRSKVAPTFTLIRAAFRNTFGSRKDDLLYRTKWRRVIRLKSILLAFVYNIGRSLYYLTGMALAKTHLRLEEIKIWIKIEVLKDFLTSLSISLEATFIILIKLGLKTPETLY